MSEAFKKSCIRLLLTIYPKSVVGMTPRVCQCIMQTSLIKPYLPTTTLQPAMQIGLTTAVWNFYKDKLQNRRKMSNNVGGNATYCWGKGIQTCKYLLAQCLRPHYPAGLPLSKPSEVQQQWKTSEVQGLRFLPCFSSNSYSKPHSPSHPCQCNLGSCVEMMTNYAWKLALAHLVGSVHLR